MELKDLTNEELVKVIGSTRGSYALNPIRREFLSRLNKPQSGREMYNLGYADGQRELIEKMNEEQRKWTEGFNYKAKK